MFPSALILAGEQSVRADGQGTPAQLSTLGCKFRRVLAVTHTEFKGEITEEIKHFDPAMWEAWKKGVRTGFPMDPRLAHFAYRQPRYYFGETLYVRELLSQGFICWQERYQLFRPVQPSSRFYFYSAEIASLLGKKRFFQLHKLHERADFSPVNPDIVAFHPEHRSWAFFEVKMPQDKIRNNQVCSLAILSHFLLGRVGIIRFIPNGKTRAPATYQYTFTLT